MTASAPKKRLAKKWLIGPVLVIFCSFLAAAAYQTKAAINSDICTIRRAGALSSNYQMTRNHCIKLTRADTPESRAKGLSGSSGTNYNQGMLFVFNEPGQHCMWMQDIYYNLDIIWLDQDKRVTHIVRNASPDTYPAKLCGSGHDQYVIEVVAGKATLPITGQRLKYVE